MRVEKSWKYLGVNIRPEHWSLYTPLGSFGIDSFRRVTEQGLPRGRCREWVFRFPLTESWQISLSTKGKDYLTLVGGPKYLKNTNWIIDEFDSSFNDLAIASLRYHMNWAPTYCEPEQRERYQDLIDRLDEPHPSMADNEEEEKIREEVLFSNGPGGMSPEARSLINRYMERQKALG